MMTDKEIDEAIKTDGDKAARAAAILARINATGLVTPHDLAQLISDDAEAGGQVMRDLMAAKVRMKDI